VPVSCLSAPKRRVFYGVVEKKRFVLAPQVGLVLLHISRISKLLIQLSNKSQETHTNQSIVYIIVYSILQAARRPGRRRSCPDGSHDAGRADILAVYRRSAGADRAKAGTSGGNSGSNGHVTREAPPSVILRVVI
jgi:hypothetical protein